MGTSKILIVEGDGETREYLHVALSRCGYAVMSVANGEHAVRSAAQWKPSLILLDLDLAQSSGVRLLASLRKHSALRVIALSARSDEFVAIKALDQGANDFVAKPFGIDSLLARVRVALRVSIDIEARTPRALFEIGPWDIDFEKFTARLGRRRAHLTPTENKLLAALVARVGTAVSHGELLRAVWGPESSEQVEYLRIYMRQLRCKLEAEPSHPRYLLTVPRVGYRLSTEAR